MRRRVKRLLDVAAALGLAVLTAPVLALAALAVAATMGRPVLFRQERSGLGGRSFTLLKLRTMRPDVAPAGAAAGDGRTIAAASGVSDHDGERLTPLGRWLRATSLDELPQLWNVLRGDMALVGPRPLLPRYLERYSPEQARRHDVLPGLTGLAQVNGRNALSWDEKLALDVRYVDTWSLRGDLAILWRTLAIVLRRDGVAAGDHATMPEFQGAPK
jgi:lipopolysaccharide/colanic/teichoic acid biosynthesis glycosyltransferase